MRTIATARRGGERRRGMALALTFVAALVFAIAGLAGGEDGAHQGEEAAVKEVVAGFSNGWNNHDARAMCASLADDVQWVSWRGEISSSRKEVEEQHARLFGDLYKNTHRSDTVKSVRFLGADLALVDDYWTMTGARTREGADWPYRAGYVNFVMARRGGKWIVIASHTADFNAKAPGQ